MRSPHLFQVGLKMALLCLFILKLLACSRSLPIPEDTYYTQNIIGNATTTSISGTITDSLGNSVKDLNLYYQTEADDVPFSLVISDENRFLIPDVIVTHNSLLIFSQNEDEDYDYIGYQSISMTENVVLDIGTFTLLYATKLSYTIPIHNPGDIAKIAFRVFIDDTETLSSLIKTTLLTAEDQSLSVQYDLYIPEGAHDISIYTFACKSANYNTIKGYCNDFDYRFSQASTSISVSYGDENQSKTHTRRLSYSDY